MSEIVRYAQKADGSRNVGVQIGAVSVLFQPSGPGHDADAERLAEQVAGVADHLAQLGLEVARKSADLADMRRRVEASEARLSASLDGKRRFFGPVLVKPHADGDWNGRVWALDPEKQERGMGLAFASLAELRLEHPELWPIGVKDGGILMDAWTNLPKWPPGRSAGRSRPWRRPVRLRTGELDMKLEISEKTIAAARNAETARLIWYVYSDATVIPGLDQHERDILRAARDIARQNTHDARAEVCAMLRQDLASAGLDT